MTNSFEFSTSTFQFKIMLRGLLRERGEAMVKLVQSFPVNGLKWGRITHYAPNMFYKVSSISWSSVIYSFLVEKLHVESISNSEDT